VLGCHTDFSRAFTEPVLQAAFSAHARDRLADQLFSRAERLIRADPERDEFHDVGVAAFLTRHRGGRARSAERLGVGSTGPEPTPIMLARHLRQ
jgi:hypothetical protein